MNNTLETTMMLALYALMLVGALAFSQKVLAPMLAEKISERLELAIKPGRVTL